MTRNFKARFPHRRASLVETYFEEFATDERFDAIVVSSIMDKAAAGEDIQIYGTHDALRNFIHVEEVARIIAAVIRRRVEGIYSCMHPRDVSYSEIAAAAIAAFGSRRVVKFVRDKPDVPDNVFEIDDSLYRRIDYSPQILIALGMQKAAAQRKYPT